MKAKRKAAEKELKKDKKDIPFPGWEALDDEGFEKKPQAILRVTNDSGKLLTEITGTYSKGIHRKHWDPSTRCGRVAGTVVGTLCRRRTHLGYSLGAGRILYA